MRRRKRAPEAEGTRRAVGYVRVSTTMQAEDGVSLAAQQAKIRAWADTGPYEVVSIHVDEGRSGGRADNRPGLQAALDEVCKTRGVLVVYSLSRLARSTRDAIAIADRLHKADADLVSLTERIDSTGATGQMLFRLLSVLSEFERDLVSERTTAALAHMRSQGQRTGEIPFGWALESDGVTLTAVQSEQAAIRLMQDLRADGWSLRAIADELTRRKITTKKGNRRWTHQAVASVLERTAA